MSNRQRQPAPPTRALQKQTQHDLSSVVDALDKRQDQFMALLGSPEAVARFRTVALHAVTSRPDLLRCDPLTIVEAIREAASLDLEPTGVLGEAWLVPYKGAAKLRIGWQGYLKLIRRAGEVAAVDCQVVYEHDVFDLMLGTDPRIHHLPALKDRGSYRGAYAWARLHDGSLIIEWLPVEDVAPIQKLAAADSLMWSQFAGEGMRKSAIRRLQKRLPKSVVIEHALKVEAEAEDVPTQGATSTARSAAHQALAARFEEPKLVRSEDTFDDGEQPASEPASLPEEPAAGQPTEPSSVDDGQTVFSDEELDELSRDSGRP